MTAEASSSEVVVPAAPVIHLQHYYSISDPDDKVIANMSIVPRHGTLFISNLWVDGKHRRKHLGTALLTRGVSEWGANDLHLQVASYTDRAFNDEQLIQWYATFGFLPTIVPGAMYRP